MTDKELKQYKVYLKAAEKRYEEINTLQRKLNASYGTAEHMFGITDIYVECIKKRLADAKKELEEYATKMDVASIVPVLKIDEKIQLTDISIQDIKDLELLEPFGEGNKMPLFQISNLKITSIRTLSEGKHLKAMLQDENKYIDTIGFNLGNISSEYAIGSKVYVVGNLEINSYKGMENIQINLKDMRHSIS